MSNFHENRTLFVSNKLKKQVSDYMLKYKFKVYDRPVKIRYTVYFKDNVKRDLLNFVSVVDKFVLDALVNRGVIKDDNYKYVIGYSVAYGGKSDSNQVIMEIQEI